MTKEAPIVPTKIIENFLTDEEIDIINAEINASPDAHNPIVINGVTERVMESIFWRSKEPPYQSKLPKSEKIIRDKMKVLFGEDLHIAIADVLRAYVPYGIHTDGVLGEYGIDENFYGAWTCVVPLDNYDSNTIIFDQHYDKTKLIYDWINEKNPEVLDVIDDETYKKYFTHMHEYTDFFKYISIEIVFPWKKGSMLAASRYKFHTSDNFIANGITQKRGIIMWTSFPYDKNSGAVPPLNE